MEGGASPSYHSAMGFPLLVIGLAIVLASITGGLLVKKLRTLQARALRAIAEAEKSLHKSEERFISERLRTERERATLAAIVESSEDATYAETTDGTILTWNAAAEHLYGYSAHEMIGGSSSGLIPENRAIELTEILERIRACQSLEHFDTKRRRKDGSLLEISLSVSPVRDRTGHVVGASSVARDVSLAKAAEREMRASLSEKDLLLKEIHHRVKNNLQVISSLLNLQARKLPEGPTRDVFRESQSRVQSMALFHERLYRGGDLGSANAVEYIREVGASVLRTFGMEARARLRVEGDVIRFGVDTAIPCGLIVNELVSNCLKHAFAPGRCGEISVVLRHAPDGQIRLAVSDDGVGLSSDAAKSPSLGLQLVTMLSQQLGGILELSSAGGTTVTLQFPLAHSIPI
jgi:PAS domain S-box-containing protein